MKGGMQGQPVGKEAVRVALERAGFTPDQIDKIIQIKECEDTLKRAGLTSQQIKSSMSIAKAASR